MATKQASDPFDLESGVPVVEGAVRPKPRFADRVSPRVIVVIVGVVLLMIGIFFAALYSMDERKKERSHEKDAMKALMNQPVESIVPKDLLTPESKDPSSEGMSPSLVTPRSTSLAGVDQGGAGARRGKGVPPLDGSSGDVPNRPIDEGSDGLAHQAAAPALSPEEQALNAAKLERIRRMQQARSDGMTAVSYVSEERKSGEGALPSGANPVTDLVRQLGLNQAGQVPAAAASFAQAKSSDSEQDEKLQFIKNGGKTERTHLMSGPMPPVSPNEVKRGSFIPMRLEVKLNSDLPGQVTARVTEDVYDTTTGCRLLIPAMSTVLGTYNSKVAIGQNRNLVVWNYMRFEDGSDMDLGTMEGYDSGGGAGIAAEVDNHYFRLFGLALGMSLVTAEVQMSVTPPPSGTTAMTTQQAISTALAQQYGQLGAQILGKYMQVQPTLKNYPGERFNIMTPVTIVFNKVWRRRC